LWQKRPIGQEQEQGSSARPRLRYRLLTLCPAPTDPVGQLWPIVSVYVCMYIQAREMHTGCGVPGFLWMRISSKSSPMCVVCACICIYIFIHTYIHTYIHACIHTYVHTYIHRGFCGYGSAVKARLFMCVCMHMYICIYPSYIHTYIHRVFRGCG
jgi:hypothetical protein